MLGRASSRLLITSSMLAFSAAAGGQTLTAQQGATATTATNNGTGIAGRGIGGNAGEAQGGIQDIIVTAQKRSESIQNVPIAVSAFTADALKAQRLDGAANLALAVPNLNFSNALYGNSNFSIRGIGYQLVTTAGDPGVGIHENNAPLDRSRIADSQFYDVERVEVLRGPQGTLYGRNSTGGVINVITAKPVNELAGSLTGEYGNYDQVRLTAFLNIPLGDKLAFRVAGLGLRRDGTQLNTLTGNDIDGKRLFSTRATLAFTPSDRFHAFALWEHFYENDTRTGGAKTICKQDPGPSSVAGVPVNSALARAYLSRGCLQSSIYDPAAQMGTTNSVATLGGLLPTLLGISPGNVNATSFQSSNPRELSLAKDPRNKARNDNYQVNLEWDVTDDLKLTSLTNYNHDYVLQQGSSAPGTIPLNTTALTPGGVFNDPQIGASAFIQVATRNDLDTKQFSQEFRLQSSFDGKFNFNVGGIYFHIKRFNDVYIFSNGLTIFTKAAVPTAYVDPNPVPDGTGHNYYEAQSPYRLNSYAGFGEVYYEATDNLKFTAGLRYTDDTKKAPYIALPFLSPGRGPLPGAFTQRVRFKELTGRANVDWRPDLSFTDNTLIYASYSRGYKGGGFNTPDLTTASASAYAPEFVNAIEIGTKNTLFDRRLVLNMTGFHYKYENFQYSVSQGLSVATRNIDATIYGIELEAVVTPVDNLQLNANVGYLHTRINGSASSTSVNPNNLTQGDPNLIELKTTGANACVGPAAGIATLIARVNAGTLPASALLSACPTVAAPQGAFAAIGVPTSFGVLTNIAGNKLPSSPSFNVAIGAQYRIELSDSWSLTPRVDYHYQGSAYSDVYNDPDSKVRAWSNVNSTITLANLDRGIQVQGFARNLFNKSPVTAVQSNGVTLGLSHQAYYLEPRLYGISLSKTF